MKNRYRKWIPVIAGITTGFVILLFLSGYLYPIEKRTPQGRITGAVGVGMSLFIVFSHRSVATILSKEIRISNLKSNEYGRIEKFVIDNRTIK